MVSAPNDIADLLASVARWLNHLRVLAADPDFAGWRHDEEPGALLKLVLDARARLESARFNEPEHRDPVVRLVVNGLPLARLRQLTGDEADGTDAAPAA
jgi:hypothetical protein